MFSQWMLGDMHGQVEQFDMLNDPELIGRGEAPIAGFVLVNFINKRFVDPLERKGLAQFALVPLLAAAFRFPASVGILVGWLYNVTRRGL